MSASTSSGVQRHRQHAFDVGTNKHNQYGLNYGYAVNPDPNDPYGWQAYEAERAKQKKHLAEMRAAAQAASRLHMQQMAASMASVGHSHSSSSGSSSSSSSGSSSSSSSGYSSTSSSSSGSSFNSASCTSSSLPRSSCSGSTSSTSPAVQALKKKEKKERQQAKEEEKKQQEAKEKRKTAKCCGAACLMKTLGAGRARPHWCDGKKWGGKIWGLARDPGDKNPDNWGVYFHPKLSRSEVVKICHRRCPPPKKRHKKVETKVVVTKCCHKSRCTQCQPVVPLPVPVPVTDEFADEFVDYGSGEVYPTTGYSAGYGGMPVDMGPGPTIPPHVGYTGHPAGNVERWRVHTADNKSSKSGSKKSSKKGSKSGSEKSSGKTNYSFPAAAPPPANKGFDNRFLYAGTEGGAGGGVQAGGNYARNEPVPIPGAAYLKSIMPHISDEVEPEGSSAPEAAAEDGQEASDSLYRSSKGKEPSRLPVPSCWVESASASTTSFEAAGGRPASESSSSSRKGRFRSRRDDAGHTREGSWERVSPQVQREREWQRLQDEERGRLQREADADADAAAFAEAEQWYKADQKAAASSSSSGSSGSSSTDRSGYSYPDFQAGTTNIVNTAASASHSSNNAPSDSLTIADSSYFAHHMGSPAKYQTASSPAPASISASASASSLSTEKPGAVSVLPRSVSSDTGYETGHDAESEIYRLSAETYDHGDPGYGSMYGSVCNSGYGAYGDYAYGGYGNGHVWGELDALSTTLMSSSARESTKEGTSETSSRKGKSKSKKEKNETKDKKGKSESSSAASWSRDGHRHKSHKRVNGGGLLAKIVW